VPGQVGLADNPDHSIAIVDHRNSSYLMVRHRLHAIQQRIVHVTCERLVGHRCTDRHSPGIPMLCDAAHGDVSVCDHSDKPIIPVDHWQRSAIVTLHQLRGVLQRILRMYANHVARHHVRSAFRSGPPHISVSIAKVPASLIAKAASVITGE
jgi:hypothetical protein